MCHLDLFVNIGREYDEEVIGPKDFEVLWLTGSI